MSSFAFRIILIFQSFAFLSADQKVNVILIFADDQGYGDLGCFGSKKIKTPHIDQMAKEGRKFTNFMVASQFALLHVRLYLLDVIRRESACTSMFFFQVQPRDCIQMNTLWLIILNLWVTLRHAMVNGTWGIILKHYPDKMDSITISEFHTPTT